MLGNDTLDDMRTLPPEDRMYRALVERDSSFDGVFYACVKTTGIFCRPTCRARKPLRLNVEFVETTREAQRLGYRACRICHPLAAGETRPPWVGDLIHLAESRVDERLRDDDLRTHGIDPVQARRYFKQHYGMTFHAYHRTRRLGRSLKLLGTGGDITPTGHASGFDSTSGFRDAFARLFGAPPGRGRHLNALVARWLQTRLGPMLAVAHDDGLCLLEFLDRRAFEHQIHTLRRRFDAVITPGDSPWLDQIERELDEYFDGDRTSFDVPLMLRGTEFQEAVWHALLAIEPGQARSYGDIAAGVGRPGAMRAVGRANGDNRLAIVVPCHRVIRSDGTLCGYGGGLWRKQWLLDHERANVVLPV